MLNNLFIITASSSEAYQHYIDTIEEGFELDRIQEFLTSTELTQLQFLYKNQKVRAWGALPGPSNKKNWEKMNVGDKVLIYRQKNYEYFGTISHKIHNTDFARHLWKENREGETWEYAYLLSDVTEVSLPVKDFNHLIGYQETNFPQGFSCISEEKMKHIAEKFESVEKFLQFLKEGKWVKESPLYSEPIKQQIIREKSTDQTFPTLLEANLEEILSQRVDQLEEGLVLVDRQLDTREVGRLDLLCIDKENNLVVIELKKGKAGSSIIDQIQRYMGWIITHKAEPEQKVRGIIVVIKKDTALEYAVKANPAICVREYGLTFR